MTLERALAIAEGTASYSEVEPGDLWTALVVLARQVRSYEATVQEAPP